LVRKIQTNPEQPDIIQHDKSTFELMVNESLRCGGLHLVASKGHGKTRFLFSIADYIRTLENSRLICFDGSLAWLYNFSQIPTFNINEADITAKDTRHTLELEHYNFNWRLVETALNNHEDILFRLKTKKPSKRGFAIRTIINYLDDIQRQQIEDSETHTPLKQIAYFIEESQDCFNNRSTARNDSEIFLTTFNEARNNKESFFTASQRLNDMSKTLRTKQVYCFGKINSEDVNPQIRRIEKLNSVDLTTLPLRPWFYEGKTFESPQWTQNKKPYIINSEIRKEYNQPNQPINYKLIPASEPKNKSLFAKILNAIFPATQNTNNSNEDSEDETENKEMDDMFLLNP
jgi:hypothetical protein